MVDVRMLAELKITESYFKYPVSYKALKSVLPYLFQDLRFVEQPMVLKNIVAHIARCVKLGEENFTKPFGGWRPASDQFGMNPLRPNQVNYTTAGTNEWIWTSGAVASVLNVFEAWIGPFNLPIDRLILSIGYFTLDAIPNTMQLQGLLGDKTLPVIDVQSLQMKQDPYSIQPDLWIILPRSGMRVNASARLINTTERMGLLGYCFGDDSEIIATA